MLDPDNSILESLLNDYFERGQKPEVTSFLWFMNSDVGDDIVEVDSLDINNNNYPWFLEHFVRYNRGE